MKLPHNDNPCMKMQCMFWNNQLIAHQLSECFELIELLMTMVLGSVKDKRCFFALNFL
jgi:hypothetical protein